MVPTVFGKMKNKITIFGMLAVLATSQACRDKCSEGERGNPYIKMAMMVTPTADTINLGDTLTVSIEIPFDNLNTRDGSRIDISRSSISEFGMDHGVSFKTSSTTHVTDGLDQFKIIYERGGGGKYTVTRTQNRFEKTATGFVFRAKIIPLKKGLVNLINYRAEGEMEKGCVLVDFTPVCGNADKHHNFLFDFYRYTGWQIATPNDNSYFVWVK
jgi:hypothetical protein